MLTTRLWQRFVKSLGNLRIIRRRLPRGRRGHRPMAGAQALEHRQLLAFTVSLSSTTVTFTGDNANDSLVLTVGGTGLLTHNLPLSGNLVSAVDLNSSQAGEQTLAVASLTSLTLNGGGRNDLLDASVLSREAAITGGTGNDALYGMAAAATIGFMATPRTTGSREMRAMMICGETRTTIRPQPAMTPSGVEQGMTGSMEMTVRTVEPATMSSTAAMATTSSMQRVETICWMVEPGMTISRPVPVSTSFVVVPELTGFERFSRERMPSSLGTH